jgi:hypothetical protein
MATTMDISLPDPVSEWIEERIRGLVSVVQLGPSHKAHKLTPAMAAGLTTSPMEMADLVAMMDVAELNVLQLRRKAMLTAAE